MNATANTRSPWRTRTTTSTGLRIRPPQINARATFIAGRRFPRTMVLLVRFGELALKSPYVRRHLRDRLVANIQDLFAAEGIECLTRADHGRIYVDVDDVPAASAALKRVFGIVSFSTAQETSSDPKDIAEIAIRLALERLPTGGSFAIRPRARTSRRVSAVRSKRRFPRPGWILIHRIRRSTLRFERTARSSSRTSCTGRAASPWGARAVASPSWTLRRAWSLHGSR